MEMIKVYATTLLSLLAGAACVHNLFKPDLTLPVEKISSSGSGSGTAAGGAGGSEKQS